MTFPDTNIVATKPAPRGTWQPDVVLCDNLKDTTLRLRRPGPLRPCTPAAYSCGVQDQSRRSPLPVLAAFVQLEELVHIRRENRGLSINPGCQSVQGFGVPRANDDVDLAAFEKMPCGMAALGAVKVQFDGQVFDFLESASEEDSLLRCSGDTRVRGQATCLLSWLEGRRPRSAVDQRTQTSQKSKAWLSCRKVDLDLLRESLPTLRLRRHAPNRQRRLRAQPCFAHYTDAGRNQRASSVSSAHV